MDYKYKRNQIFGKRLKVPKYILKLIYDQKLTYDDYFYFELDDKIPTTCLIETDRKIIEKFGPEKAKNFDWELLNLDVTYDAPNFREVLLELDPKTEDINASLYEIAKKTVRPFDYSKRMKEAFPERFFTNKEIEDDIPSNTMHYYNRGELHLDDIIENWRKLEGKDLSFCLMNDPENKFNITEAQVRAFTENYSELGNIIIKHGDIYEFISDFSKFDTKEEKDAYVKTFIDELLDKTIEQIFRGKYATVELDDYEYETLFKYTSVGDYLAKKHYFHGDILKMEVDSLPPDYLFNLPIPFTTLIENDVLEFVSTYGIKNVIDFDTECGNFFTRNNCRMLRLMEDMYLHYSGNQHDPERTIHVKKIIPVNGVYEDRLYTKDEFYEAMRRMIIYGPSDYNFIDSAPNYRDMVGEFRIRNAELFISEDAPQELQDLFYTKSLKPEVLIEHPEYIPYLKGKNLEACFKQCEIPIEKDGMFSYISVYRHLLKITDFDTAMKTITEYNEILQEALNFNENYAILINQRVNYDANLEETLNEFDNWITKIIIAKGKPYPKIIPEHLKKNKPEMFLSEDAPQELQEAFYNRTITTEFILSKPEYKDYFKDVDLAVLYKYMAVGINKSVYGYSESTDNFINLLVKTFGKEEAFDFMLSYGKYIEETFNANKLSEFNFRKYFQKADFIEETERVIKKAIIDGQIKYDENLPQSFKDKNPTLFLDENLPKEMRDKFYNREFTMEDFEKNPELLEKFGDTNIICGFSQNVSWMIPLFEDYDNVKEANEDRLKVVSAFTEIQDVSLQNSFRDYVVKYGKTIDVEKIQYISEVLNRLANSNSSEIYTFRNALAGQILNTENPIESLNQIESIFLKNNIPTFAKIYSCFEILHPDFAGFSFENSQVSPTLKHSSTNMKKAIVFSDLLKASIGSNNRSVEKFLNTLENGNNLYKKIESGELHQETLDYAQKKELISFSQILATLYNNTMINKKHNESYVLTDEPILDIKELRKKLSPNGDLNYNLADRAIRMFASFAGINTLEEAKTYVSSKIANADARNRKAAQSEMKLEKGDLIKGIGSVKYLRTILQNGSVSKEFLGASASSDATPLDTDISMIITDVEGNKAKIESCAANGYGPIYFVLKNDDRFKVTRKMGSVETDTLEDKSKLEVFYTGVLGEGHYGIRTGFASSEIDYIVMENFDEKVALEIALNGFYIPIADKEGKIIFTPKQYDQIRAKMAGLSYYGETEYIFSDSLVTKASKEVVTEIRASQAETERKREKLIGAIKKSLDEMGIEMKLEMDGDLTEGSAELIDTGSTGRGTNEPGDGDFDLMMRLDKSIIANPQKLAALKKSILKNIGRENDSTINSGDFRLKKVQLDDINIDIDITFTEKTDSVTYSTDMAIKDRMETMKKQDPEKYEYVVANVILAKRVMKEAGAYKPNRGEVPQGGLGGVGVENWILQHGGSFLEAAKSFVEAAEGKNFSEFLESYSVWDFGENHLAERKGFYPHDNFVRNNMSEEGFKKLVPVLQKYIKENTKTVQNLAKESWEEQKDVSFLDSIESAEAMIVQIQNNHKSQEEQ